MNTETIAKALRQLGKKLCNTQTAPFFGQICTLAASRNPRLQADAVVRVLENWGQYLAEGNFPAIEVGESHRVAIVSSETDEPFCAIADWLTVLLAGHTAVVKTSDSDEVVLPAMARVLADIEPLLAERTEFAKGPIGNFDAIVATAPAGSAAEQYFSRFPHYFRAPLPLLVKIGENHTAEQLLPLCKHIFGMAELGYSPALLLQIPEEYDFKPLFQAAESFRPIFDNHLYRSSIDYHKSIFLLNAEPFADGDFWILRNNGEFLSPLGITNYTHGPVAEKCQEMTPEQFPLRPTLENPSLIKFLETI